MMRPQAPIEAETLHSSRANEPHCHLQPLAFGLALQCDRPGAPFPVDQNEPIATDVLMSIDIDEHRHGRTRLGAMCAKGKTRVFSLAPTLPTSPVSIYGHRRLLRRSTTVRCSSRWRTQLGCLPSSPGDSSALLPMLLRLLLLLLLDELPIANVAHQRLRQRPGFSSLSPSQGSAPCVACGLSPAPYGLRTRMRRLSTNSARKLVFVFRFPKPSKDVADVRSDWGGVRGTISDASPTSGLCTTKNRGGEQEGE